MRLAKAWLITATAWGLAHSPLLAAAPDEARVVVTVDRANLRASPAGRVLGTASRSTELELLGEQGGWLKVKDPASGSIAYVHTSLVQRVSVPAPREEAPPAPVAADAPSPAEQRSPPAAVEASAIDYAPPPPPPSTETPGDGPRFAVGLEGGYQDLTSAARSAKAVFGGSSGAAAFGFWARYSLRRNVFVAAGIRVFQKEGQRVYVADAAGQVFGLGHPLKVRLMPAYALAGYRFSTRLGIAPYLAVGGGVTSFREESTVGGVADLSSSSKASGHLAVGVEYRRGSLLAGIEGMWSTVPDSAGVGGVSHVYGETDLGGFSVALRLGFAR